MILEYLPVKDKVYINSDLEEELETREYQSNIDALLRLENKEELISSQLDECKDKLNKLKKGLRARKKYKKWIIIALTLTFSILPLLGIYLGLVSKLALIMTPFALLPIGIPIAIFTNELFKDLPNPKTALKDRETLEAQIKYFSQELEEVKAKKESLNYQYQEIKPEEEKVSLVSYNNAQKALLEKKLQLIEEYIRRKEEYQASYQKGELDKMISTPEEGLIIRELIINDKK